MENIGLALANLSLGLCFLIYARRSWSITTPIPLMKNNITWLYYSIAFVCFLMALKFVFYNLEDFEDNVYGIIQQCILLAFSFTIYFLLAIRLTLKYPSRPRKIRALLLIPIAFYALFTFQWPSFIYANIILIGCIAFLFFYIAKKYALNRNRQLILGLIGILGLSFLTLFQNYLEDISNPIFFIFYIPAVLSFSFFTYRGIALLLNKANPLKFYLNIKNNASNYMTSTAMYQSMLPKTIHDTQVILNLAKNNQKAISCLSSGYSIGGQCLLEGGVLMELKKISGVDFFDSVNGIIKVGPATSWLTLRRFLAHHQKNNPDIWAADPMPTHFLDYSIAGAVSSNIHGNNLFATPIIQSIKSIDVLDASGKIQTLNRTLHPEWFNLVIGGYGLFGVIMGIELNLSKKRILQRKVSILSIHDLTNTINQHIQSGALYFEVELNTNEKDTYFLKNGILSTYIPSDIEPQKTLVLRSSHSLLNRENLALFYNKKIQKISLRNKSILEKNNQYYWSDDIVPHYALEKNLKWVNLFFPDYEDHHYIQQTYYLPIPTLGAFLKHLRQHKICKEFNLLQARVTIIKKNTDSFLHYANQDFAALELTFYTVKSDQSLKIIKDYLTELTETSVFYHGCFSLGYLPCYEKDHLLKAYPQINDFLKLKLKYDPGELFQSTWYQNIKKLCSDIKSDKDHSLHFTNVYGPQT